MKNRSRGLLTHALVVDVVIAICTHTPVGTYGVQTFSILPRANVGHLKALILICKKGNSTRNKAHTHLANLVCGFKVNRCHRRYDLHTRCQK